MAACSRGLMAPPFDLAPRRAGAGAASWPRPSRGAIRCCCYARPEPRRLLSPERAEERRVDGNKTAAAAAARGRRRGGLTSVPLLSFPSSRSRRQPKQQDFYPRCTPRGPAPQSRDTPPKRDTGIASEKEWGINLLDEAVKESGTNEDGSTWYRESGEDLGENGFRCRWARMGGQTQDGSTEWKETWWEKSDWTGYKELGAEKSGKNAEGDSWWEKWKEVLHQDEWRNQKLSFSFSPPYFQYSHGRPTSCGVSRPFYGVCTRLEDTARDLFTRHGWQHNLRIGPPSSS